jgi:D-glycero-alpha-D-manno-heptose-7-phosphate kinase
MILAKCPLRISLAGGSTDLQDFIDHYGRGAVINFPVSLYTYITLSSDISGYNKIHKKYIINYSKREEEENIEDIKNDIAREVLRYFDCEQISCSFTSDILSSGSGLASSSSYTIAFVKAVSKFKKLKLSDFEICKISLDIERKFNNLTGFQDIYGCGIGSLKRMDFIKKQEPKFTYLPQKIFNDTNMYLIFTNVTRHSTEILKNIDLHKREKLLSFVDLLEKSIRESNKDDFFNIIREGWIQKKESSPFIVGEPSVKEIDSLLSNDTNILAHRLCGAGNGGFFLVFTKEPIINNKFIPISISDDGVKDILV